MQTLAIAINITDINHLLCNWYYTCRLRSLSDSGSSSGLQSSFSAGAAGGTVGVGSQYKLADHRYGREELLALYQTTSSVSPDLQDTSVMVTKPLLPLALVPMSEEEQVSSNYDVSISLFSTPQLLYCFFKINF